MFFSFTLFKFYFLCNTETFISSPNLGPVMPSYKLILACMNGKKGGEGAEPISVPYQTVPPPKNSGESDKSPPPPQCTLSRV